VSVSVYTYYYTELCHFFQIIIVSPCQCLCRVLCPVSFSVCASKVMINLCCGTNFIYIWA
jgi:hypothetical protein